MPKSQSLSALAERIRAEHAAVIATSRKGIEHAFAAGQLLIEAQDLVPYGEWGRWLAENCATLSTRTASRYMRLARARPVLEEHFRHSGETDPDALPLRAAEEFLGPEPDPEPEPEPEPESQPEPEPEEQPAAADAQPAPEQPQPPPSPPLAPAFEPPLDEVGEQLKAEQEQHAAAARARRDSSSTPRRTSSTPTGPGISISNGMTSTPCSSAFTTRSSRRSGAAP